MNRRELYEQTCRDVEAARLPIAELVNAMLDGPNRDPVDILSALATVTTHLAEELFDTADFKSLLTQMVTIYSEDRAARFRKENAN